MAALRELRTKLGLRKRSKQKFDPNAVILKVSGVSKKVHGTWFRGDSANFHPVRASLFEPDSIEKYVGKGWFPDAPIIDKKQYVTAFGSCFASEVTNFLYDEGYRVFGRDLTLDAHIVRSGDGIVNSAALLQQFEWAFNGWTPSSELWHDATGVAGPASDDIKNTTRRIFTSTDVFILTLGLSEVWHDTQSGDVFWRAIPRTQFDPSRHGFRVLSVEENRNNLRRVYQILRQHRPDAEIILTLSPIPLAATFRPISCITANSVSKASLRVAIDDVLREFAADSKLHYFPSYEIVTAFMIDPMAHDLRHPKREVVATIMEVFKKAYLK